MATDPALAIAVSSRDWPDRLRQSLADHGGGRVRLTALSVQDVEEEHHDVFFVDDISSLLSRGLVLREQARGRRVVGVFDPAEPSGRQHLLELGVEAVIACDEPAEEFVRTAHRLAVGAAERTPSGDRPAPVPASDLGALVDVRGISGGVGTTEIALALAQNLGSAVVAELGPLPSLAQRVGLDLHPNFATAVEIVDHAGGAVSGAVQRIDPNTGVLVGSPEPAVAGRGAARRVLDSLRSMSAWTVLDGGTAPTAPVSTDHAVFVSVATPVGIARCVDALRGRDLTDTHVVLNRSPRGAFERAEVMRSVLCELRPRSLTIASEDPAVAAAAWNGQPVGPCGFLKAVESLAMAIRRAA